MENNNIHNVKPGQNNQRPVRPVINNQNQNKRPVRPLVNNERTTEQQIKQAVLEDTDDELDDFSDELDFGLDDTDESVQNNNEQNIKEQNNKSKEESNSTKKLQKPKKEKIKKEKPVKQEKTKKEKVKKEKVKKEKPQKQQKEKSNNTKKFNPIIILPIVIVLVVIVVIIKLVTGGSGNKHITIADENPNTVVLNTEEQLALVENTESTEQLEVSSTETLDSTEQESQQENVINKANESIKVPLIVNTKLEGDTEYTDHESYLSIILNDIVTGYDNVKPYIDEHNSNSKQIIKIDDKETFYNNSNNSDLAMINLDVEFPEDYPTQETDGTVLEKLSYELNVIGTKERDSIETNKYLFSIPKPSAMYNEPDKITRGNTYNYKWIIMLPEGIDKDSYSIELKITGSTLENKEKIITFEGCKIDLIEK